MSTKLANVPQLIEIGGETYKAGKLTIGISLEIESHLATLKTPLEKIQESKILEHVEPAVAESILSTAMQELAFWPPDAVNALCDSRFLLRASFGVVFVRAMLRQYNAHLSHDDLNRVATLATVQDVLTLQSIASGVDPNGPKGVAEPPPTTTPSNDSTGDA